MEKRFALDLFGLELTVSKGHELLILRPKKNESGWPATHKPRLRDGKSADHVSFSLKPLEKGPHAGQYAVHLTWNDGHHEFLRAVPQSRLESFGKQFEREILRVHLGTLRPTTRKKLARDGWFLIRPPSLATKEMADLFVKRAGKYRVTEAVVDHAIGMVQRTLGLLSPRWLNIYRLRYPGQPLSLIRVAKSGESESAFAYFYDRPERRGWYMGPANFAEALQASGVEERLLGSEFKTVMLIVMRELQADCDIEDIIARGEGRNQPQDVGSI